MAHQRKMENQSYRMLSMYTPKLGVKLFYYTIIINGNDHDIGTVWSCICTSFHCIYSLGTYIICKSYAVLVAYWKHPETETFLVAKVCHNIMLYCVVYTIVVQYLPIPAPYQILRVMRINMPVPMLNPM